jgi:pimeloyl-ACP methyl ester carboxylesterase/DNA-binding CsgD family transcriptional regulator
MRWKTTGSGAGILDGDSDHLTHLVYEASLDNSLWPELILELTEQLLRVRSGDLIGPQESGALSGMIKHFRRAFDISEKIVGLQEREAHLGKVLDSFSFGLALIDENGQVILANQQMQQCLPLGNDEPCGMRLLSADAGEGQGMEDWVACCNRNNQPQTLHFPGAADQALLMLPREEVRQMGFPAQAAAMLISTGRGVNDGLRSFSRMHDLTRRESDLAGALCKTGDLRAAAQDMGISYQSARTYLKRVFEKTNCSSQAELVSALAHTPMAVLRQNSRVDADVHDVRRLVTLSDGRTLEYFTLGPETGDAVVFFDAAAGNEIDIVGLPAECLPHLERHNIRLITPCRPGTFRSDPKPMKSLREFAPDVAELLDHEGIARFSVCAVSFGSASALGVTHELQHRIDRLLLSSAYYPKYQHPNWRDLDHFYHLSNVLGQKFPALVCHMLPFFVRSVMQNADKYFDRYIKNSRSAHDIEVLSNPTSRRRCAEMLGERTAAGMAGMVEENLLNAKGWDFDLGEIKVPVELVHGTLDNVSPIEGGALLAEHLPNAVLHPLPEKGHYHNSISWPWMLARAAGRDVEIDSESFDIPLR